jgi:hypothetical protein
MVTKLGPLCKVKLLKNNGDKTVVRSPEKAGVSGSTPNPGTTFQVMRAEFHVLRKNPQRCLFDGKSPAGAGNPRRATLLRSALGYVHFERANSRVCDRFQ